VQVAVDYKFSRRRLEQNLFAFNNVTVNHQIGLKLRGKKTNKLKWDLLSIIKIQVLIPISFIFEWKRIIYR
jgi:hypothetical protein